MNRRMLLPATLAALALAGCAARVPVATERCQPAPEEVVASIQGGMEEPGFLRNGFAVQSTEAGRIWLVSAEFVEEGRDPELRGDIFTFATTDPNVPAAEYLAVDPNSRERSRWPSGGDITVKTDGTIESRACVNELRPDQGGGGLLGGS